MSGTIDWRPEGEPGGESGPDDPAVVAALREYEAALEAGRRPDRAEFLARHPAIAGALGPLLDALEFAHAGGRDVREQAGSPAGTPGPDPPPSPLGDFHVVREVGRGGMGVVYEAEQLSLHRRVALKVLPFAASLDARQLQRFRNEAHAAAQLHHTNIVPVFATGCDRGVHYYAMQFIDGRTLRDVIEALRGAGSAAGGADAPAAAPGDPAAGSTLPVAALSTARSAGDPSFFRTVAGMGVQAAEALEYAHQLGVVHRDVKPANLLMDARGNLWVADFGLAMVQTDAGLTMTGDLVGTLRYMSPEQALAVRGVVDHRTDVYSLGVTLYELLTLEPAVPGVGRAEVLRRLSFDEPRPPRGIDPAIPPELETIVLKAAERNPADRYATAQELADDLRRFLDDKPILAKRPTPLQRARRWARRHKTAVRAAGAAAAAGLVAVTATVSLMYRQLQYEESQTANARDLAVEERRQARRVVHDLSERAAERLADEPHGQGALRELLTIALEYYEAQARRSPTTPDEQRENGLAHRKVGDIAGRLGRHEQAEQAYTRSIEIFAGLAAGLAATAADRREEARGHNNLGGLLADVGRLKEAEDHLDRALALHGQLRAESPGDREHDRETAGTANNLANLLKRVGRLEDADKAYRRALRLLQDLADDAPAAAAYRRELALTLMNRGTLFDRLGMPKEAEEASREALRLQEVLLAAQPKSPAYRQDLAATLNNLALLLGKDPGRRPEAEKAYWRALEVQAALADDFPEVLTPRLQLARTRLNLGNLLKEDGRLADAEAVYGEALALLDRLAADFPTVPVYSHELVRTLNQRGQALELAGRRPEADAAHTRAVGLARGLAEGHPGVPEYRQELARTHHARGNLARAAGRLKDAEVEYQHAVGHYAQLQAEFAVPEYARELALSRNNLGNVLKATGRPNEAAQAHREALAALEELAARFPGVPAYRHEAATARLNLASVQRDLGRQAEAEASCRLAAEALRKLAAAYPGVALFREDCATALNTLGTALKVAGRTDDAAAAYDEAIARRKELTTASPGVPRYRWHLAQSHFNKGQLCKDLGRPDAAARELDLALELLTPLAAGPAASPDHRLDMARALGARAALLVGRDNADANKRFTRALDTLEELAAAYPDRPDFRAELGSACCDWGVALKRVRAAADVEKVFRRGVAVHEQLMGKFPDAPAHRHALACTLTNLGAFLCEAGRAKEAEECLARAATLLRALTREGGGVPAYREHLAVALYHVGSLLRAAEGRSADAGTAYAESVEAREELVARHPHAALYRTNLCETLTELALLLRGRGDAAGARQRFERVGRLLRDAVGLRPSDPEAHNQLAWFLATCPDERLRDAPAAVRHAERAIELGRPALGPPALGAYWNTLGVAWYRAGDWVKAIESLEKSVRLQGENPFDFFFLAMAHWQRGDKTKARDAFDMAAGWQNAAPGNEELRRIRTEAAAVLGLAR